MRSVWPTRPLREICDIQIGKTPSRSERRFWGGGNPWLSIKDMNQGRELSETAEGITDVAVEEQNCRLVEPGTVLLSFKLSIGKVGIAQRPMYTNEAIAQLPLTTSDVDRDYLYWALRTVPLTGDADRAAMGATLNKTKLKRIPIPMPPIEEQRRIAAVLDAADALRAKRREALARLDTLKQAIFIDMFGDVFDPRQDDEATVPLGDLMAKRRRSADPRKAPDTTFDLYSIPAFDAGASELVLGAEIGSSKPEVAEGDVLLSRIVPHIRRCWIVGEPRGHPQVGSSEWIIFRQGEVVPAFLQAALVSDTFHARFMQTVAGVGGSLLRARPAHVAEIRIGLPPRDDQAEFARRAEAVARSLADATADAVKLDELFASLQQRAFRGEL